MQVRRDYAFRHGFLLVWAMILPVNFGILQAETSGGHESFLSNREISLSSFHQENLNRDLPAQTILLEQNKGLWISGQKSLWKWDFHKNRLFQIPLSGGTDPMPLMQHILRRGEEIFVAGSGLLFQIRFRPLKVFRYDAEKEAKTLALKNGQDAVYWLLNKGIRVLNPERKLIKRHQSQVNLREGDLYHLPRSSEKLWILRGNSLLLHSLYEDQPQGTSRMFELSYPLRGIAGLKNGFLLNTGFTVLLMSPKGHVAKTIPVEGKNRVALMDIRTRQHSYLFNNHDVEIYRVPSQKSYFTRLPPGPQVRAFRSHQSVIALLAEGKPRVFQLEGLW